MDRQQVTDIVNHFTTELVHTRLAALDSISPGFRSCEAAETLVTQLAMCGTAGTTAPADWLTLALYGQRLIDADPPAMLAIADSLGRLLFAIPGQETYHVSPAWADTRMGALWWSAVIRAEGDALITLAEASRISGMSLTALNGRIVRGTLRSWTNPNTTNSTNGRTLIRRADIEAARRSAD